MVWLPLPPCIERPALFLCLFFGCANAGLQVTMSSEAPLARTDCGPVAGTKDATMGGFVYHGVPYAMPPIGQRRWKRSELLKDGGGCWKGVFNARAPAPVCAQLPIKIAGTVYWQGVEDCLTLDIWSRMHDLPSLSPVLVDIHGGSLIEGGPDQVYGFQDENFVIVGVRYRLNVLGFLAVSELSKGDPKGVSGNYGFSDQITALQWTQKNAHAFNGNPNHVTIIGCSSGGTSVWNMLVAPAAKGLFHAAIPLSSASRNNVTLAQAERDNSIFVERACSNEVDRYKCLMQLPMNRIMDGFLDILWSFPFWDHPDFELPSSSEYQSGLDIVDGVVIPTSLQTALRTPELHAHVPVLAGSCSQEGDTARLPKNASKADFVSLVSRFVTNVSTASWPANAVNRILELYPPDAAEFGGKPKVAMDSLVSDIRVICGTHFNAQRLVEGRGHGTSPAAADVWIYYSDLTATSQQRVSHCYTMDTLSAPKNQGCQHPPCAEVDKSYYTNMIRVHSDFIKTGQPPGGLMKRMGSASGFEDGNYMLNIIGGKIKSTRSKLKDRCDFWQSTRILEQFAWNERRLQSVLRKLAIVV